MTNDSRSTHYNSELIRNHCYRFLEGQGLSLGRYNPGMAALRELTGP